MAPPTDAEIVTAKRVILLVGLGYLAAQLLVFSEDRAPGWDESIYLSQVAPDAEPLPFVPSRARGITYLVAPVLQLDASMEEVRLFLTIASAVALVGSAWMWAPVLGFGAPAGALLFAGAWPTLFYGSEVMPNLWAAFPASAATAILARRFATGPGRFDELIAGGCLAVMALLRPLDATVLGAVLILVSLVHGRRSLLWITMLLLGLAAGWAPWFVEMSARFGGPAEALSAAAEVGHIGRWSVADNLSQYLALTDGPTVGPVPDPSIPRSGLFWLIGLTALLLLGVLAARRRGSLAIVLVPIAAAIALAAEYVAFTSAQAPRFLLPALVLLAFPAGFGLAELVRGMRPPIARRGPRFAAGFAATALTAAWTASQLTVAAKIERGVTPGREGAERAGLEVRRLRGDDSCQLYSSTGFPMVGLAAGCRAAPLAQVEGDWERRAAGLLRDGFRPYLLYLGDAPPLPPPNTVTAGEVAAERGRTWFIYGWSG